MKEQETHPALSHTCPFCKADPGTPCLARNSGREQRWPHTQRTALTKPVEQTEPRVNALCCTCGNLRTVSRNHCGAYNDPNNSNLLPVRDKGWRSTKTLKCSACGEQTRHAILRPSDCSYRDGDEKWQRIALGDKDTNQYGHLTDVERLRREYRENSPFPRNPYLKHRFIIESAGKAWEAGVPAIALCGESELLESDPRKWGSSKKDKKCRAQHDGYLVAEVVSEIELTDLDTGLEWVDMDCVDCCRVSNNLLRVQRRDRLAWFLSYFTLNTEGLPDHRVSVVLDYLEELYKATQQPDR